MSSVDQVYILPCLQELRKAAETEQEPGLIDYEGNIKKLTALRPPPVAVAAPMASEEEEDDDEDEERPRSATLPEPRYADLGRHSTNSPWADRAFASAASHAKSFAGLTPGQSTRGRRRDYGSRLFNPHWFDESYVRERKLASLDENSLKDLFGDARKNFFVPLVPVDEVHPQKACPRPLTAISRSHPKGIEWATLLRFMATFCGAPAPVQPNSGDDTATAPRKKTLMLVSHHHRIALSYFPMKGFGWWRDCNAYANCICFKVTIVAAGEPVVSIVFGGFKDKETYKYCNQYNIKQISKAKLNAGISLLTPEEKEKLVGCSIYLIRHGNSLHNKPSDIKTIDSVLTYTGRAEAIHLGNHLRVHEKADFNNDLLIGTSFLSRAQLTALEVLNAMGKIGPGLTRDLNLLRISAEKKFRDTRAKGPTPRGLDETVELGFDKFAGGKIRKKQRKTINKRKNNKKTNKRKNKRLNKTNKRLNKTQKRK